ncbi:hypothetical protein [Thiomicrorhabdus cannonii]|uniref:hypothetical protein n=1 Tax=Thiomicrorhabdus cannonii TaxID=2748011 RepID=UPI0015BF6D5B|nr:hypothetical protein [Thiomicrorhabdus cannonii]
MIKPFIGVCPCSLAGLLKVSFLLLCPQFLLAAKNRALADDSPDAFVYLNTLALMHGGCSLPDDDETSSSRIYKPFLH